MGRIQIDPVRVRVTVCVRVSHWAVLDLGIVVEETRILTSMCPFSALVAV